MKFFERRKFFLLLFLIILILNNCKKEQKIYRIMDHLKEKNILLSPLDKLYQKFEVHEEKIDKGRWKLLDELSTDDINMWGISTEFPILGLYEKEKPPGMKVYKDGEEIKILKEEEGKDYGWKWLKGNEVISLDKKRFSSSLNKEDFFERSVILPEGPLFIDIRAGTPLESSVPYLKVELNDKIIKSVKISNKTIGKPKVYGLEWYRIPARVNFGEHKLKLSVSKIEGTKKIENEESVIQIEKIRIKSLNDIVLVANPKKNSFPNGIFKVSYYKDPNTIVQKAFFIIDPLLNYYYSIFNYKYRKEFMLYDSGNNENLPFIKKKLITGDISINALLAPPKSEFNYEMKVPKNAVLTFGFGLISEPNQKELNDVQFKIITEHSNKKNILFTEKLSYEKDKEGKVIYKKINLEKFKGKRIKFHFITDFYQQGDEKEKGNIKCNIAYWYNPVIYQKTEGKPYKKNVILISLDTLRADHLGCYGYKRNTTPNIDKLVQESVLFENAFSQAPSTLPSHMSMLTALYPVNHNVYVVGNKINPRIKTLSDAFRENSYFTSAFTGGHMVSAAFGFSKGFDFYQENKESIVKDTAEKLYQKTSLWLDKNKDKNFFLFLHTYQTHDPYYPPEKYQVYSDHNAKWSKKNIWDALGGDLSFRYKDLGDEKRKNLIDLYDGEIKYTDECLIKPLIEKLKKQNLYDNTMIIITSDHGEEFFDHHGWFHCHSLYNELIRVPLIIKFPNAKYKGNNVENNVGIIDIMPTVLKAVGINPSQYKFDGRDLSSFIGKNQSKENIVFTEERYIKDDELRNLLYIPGKLSIVTDKFKLILTKPYTQKDISFFTPPLPNTEEIELYNIKEDFLEKNNIGEAEKESVRNLIEKLNVYLRFGKTKTIDEGKVKIDDALRERLRSLGYIR